MPAILEGVMDYISFYVDEKGQRFGVDLATGKKTRIKDDAAEQTAEVPTPAETTDSED
jgi:hypothetical protein